MSVICCVKNYNSKLAASCLCALILRCHTFFPWKTTIKPTKWMTNRKWYLQPTMIVTKEKEEKTVCTVQHVFYCTQNGMECTFVVQCYSAALVGAVVQFIILNLVINHSVSDFNKHCTIPFRIDVKIRIRFFRATVFFSSFAFLYKLYKHAYMYTFDGLMLTLPCSKIWLRWYWVFNGLHNSCGNFKKFSTAKTNKNFFQAQNANFWPLWSRLLEALS